MSGSFREPLEAKVLDDPAPPARRRGSGWLAASAAFVLFVVCFAGLMWGLGKLLHTAAGVRQSRSDSLVDRWETSTEHVAAIRSALEAGEIGLSSAEQRELRRFFDKLESSLRPQSQTPFQSLVDLPEFAERILRHPQARARSRSDRGLLEQQLEHRVHAPGNWNELTIVRGERNKQGNEALVYTVAADWDGPPCLVRWWLRREGRNWRICDWELIDRGWSEAARWAWETSSENTPADNAYRQAIAGIQAAEGHFESEHLALGAAELLKVTASELPAVLHDLVQIELAWAWDHCGRSDQVLAACDRLQDPAAFPAIEYLRALAYARREDFPNVAAAAERYRTAAGRHPHLLEVEATAREALGERAGAADCWWQRLALLPEDEDALSEFCRLTDDAGRQRAAQLLARARQPHDFALRLARTAVFRDDEATLQVVERYFSETAPQAAARELVAGWRLDRRGEFEAAAKHFHAAAEQAAEAQERRDAWQRYLEAMAHAGRGGEALAAVPDSRAALAILTFGLDEGDAPVEIKDLPPLVAEQRKRDPNDPRLPYLGGLVALAAKDYAAAEAEFRKAADVAAPPVNPAEDEDLVELSRDKLAEALYRQGKLPAAYQALADEPNRFQQLAWLCRNDGNWRALDQLIVVHRRQQPGDAWISYFQALQAQDEGDQAAALAAVQRAEAGADEALRQTLSWLKNQLLIEGGGISQAYLNSSDQREAFRRLVTHLVGQEDWDGVLELANLHGSLAPRRSATLYWTVAAHWHRGEYQELVSALTPWPEDRVTRLDAGQLSQLCDLLVRSLLRLGRLSEAEEAALRARESYGLEPPTVALKLAQGDRPGLIEMLEQPRIARAVFARQLYRDRDLAALLTAPDVAPIRRKQALPLPTAQGPRDVELVLFFEKAVAVEELRKLAKAVGLEDVNGAPEKNAADRTISFQADRGPEALVLTAGSGRYCPPEMLPDRLAGDPRRKIIEQHGGWVALDLLSADDPLPSSDLPGLATRLATELEKLHPQAVYLSAGRVNRLELCNFKVRQQLANGELLKAALAKPAIKLPASRRDAVFLFAAAPGEHDPVEQAALRRSLRELADRSRVGRPAGHALVRIELTRGHAREEQWLKVVRSRREKFGGDEFLAELTADSKLWPFLRTGERLRLENHDVLEVREAVPAAPVAAAPVAAAPCK